MPALGTQTKYRRDVEYDREEEWNGVCEYRPRERIPAKSGSRGLRIVQRLTPVHRIERYVHELGGVEDHKESDPTST